MKMPVYAIAALALFFASSASADIVAPKKIVQEPGPIQAPHSGIVKDYYISLRESNGNCSTVVVSAKTPIEALNAG